MTIKQSNISAKIITMTSNLTYTIGQTTKTVPPMAAYVEETDDVPYCCYQINTDSARMAKSGIVGWDSSVSLYIVSDGEDEANLIKNAIVDAIETYRSTTFFPKITDITSSYSEGCWYYKIDYNFLTLV